MSLKNKGQKATIDAIVCDQGNGSSHCSLCYETLDHGDPRNNPPLGSLCPGCGATLVDYGDCYMGDGGSDF